jgi:hypothetical protein
MRYSLMLFLFITFFVSAQDTIVPSVIDSKFREDHFYLGIHFNTFQNKPEGFSQRKLSPGFHFGYLRDIPINKKRTLAIAPGLGFSYLSNNLNMVIEEIEEQFLYQTVNANSFSKNRLSYYSIDFPIELRWRNTTPESHRFFRVHTGIKMGYMLRSIYVNETQNESTRIYNNPNINRFVYGLYLAAGYNTWNVYAYYGLNKMFDTEAQLNGVPLEISTISLGLQFYIL